jgi:hypothetical protein
MFLDRFVFMKKLSVVIALVMLAGCGQTATKLEYRENSKVSIPDNKFYPITVIKSPQISEYFGLMLNVPDGFMLDDKHYKESGDFVFNYKDRIASFAVKFKSNPGLHDAKTYTEMNVVKPNEKVFSFGRMETIDNWSVPMPTLEDFESCQASHARVSYDRQIEDTVLTGNYFVWWFTIPKIKDRPGESFAIIISQECKKDDWGKISPMFELMRQTMFRLPARHEVNTLIQLTSNKKSLAKAGFDKINDRLFKLENGEPFAPGWDTLVGKYVYALDTDTMTMFLVPKQETASRLLPHPTISGWTVNPELDIWLTDYLEIPEAPKNLIPPVKKP